MTEYYMQRNNLVFQYRHRIMNANYWIGVTDQYGRLPQHPVDHFRRMLLSNENGDEKWLVPINDIPENWKPGDEYDSGVQVMA